jgi:hypothetical protein
VAAQLAEMTEAARSSRNSVAHQIAGIPTPLQL